MIALADLLAEGGRLHGAPQAVSFGDFCYDSRLARPGELFLALRTPHADGRDFIADALAAGATGVICPSPPPGGIDATMILADDPARLIQRWAAARLAAVAPLTVAVTGSVGKTSTVRALAALLGQLGPVFRSRQSFNSLLGLPIALARLREQNRYAVLEFGADRFGEIEQLAALFPPHVAVVTSVGAAHLDAFGSLEGAAREKGALVEALPANGWAVLNGDDPRVAAMRERTAARVLTFGMRQSCDLRAADIRYSLEGTQFRLELSGNVVDASIALLGEPAVTIALAAVGAALACGLTLEQAAQALAAVEPIAGRLRALPGRGGSTLIDDSFSAALPAVLAALRTLAALPARGPTPQFDRRIAVLGQPAGIGPEQRAANAEIGALAGQAADVLICKGDWGVAAVEAARRARPKIDARVVHTTAAALAALPSDLGPGDLVLIKGEAEARMERVTADLLAQPERAPAVLVRQEPAWRSVRAGAPDRPTWLRIDLDAIAHNIRRLREIAGVPLMVTLKADAYGHGATRVARAALASGAEALAVATLGEARTLRHAGIAAPVLVFGYTPPWQARDAIGLGATCTIFDLDSARALAEAAAALERPATVHVKVDTGMARLGLPPEQAPAFLRALADYPNLRVEGLYTHFATADSADETFARMQLRRFERLLRQLTTAGLRPPLIHAANSAALLRLPGARFDMARPGIACYGLRPSAETPLPPDFRPALSFHTEIAQVRSHPAGTPLSYGGAFVTQRPARIATIPVGYADGLRRSPPWREVLVRGRRAPIVGRICMDYALIDVSEIAGARRGDPVVLIGAQGDQSIGVEEVAEWLGTISYEVVATILPRVPRETL
jgi:alanine racemase